MRILFGLHTYLPEGKGGTEMHVHALAKALGRTRPVRVVTREGDPSKPDFAVTREVYEGVEVTRINHLFRDVHGFEWIYKNRRVHELFEQELVDFRPDLVHLHHLTGLSTTIVETVKRGGLPLVMTLHDFWTVCPRGQRMTKELDLCENVDRNVCFHCLAGIWPNIFKDFEKHRIELDSRGKLAPKDLAEFDRHLAYILGLADLLIAPSSFHRERMLDFPLPADRMVALPHGLDHAPYRGVVRAPRPVKRIGYFGSVIPVKGVHVLVEAFNLLKRADLELHVHGDAPPFHDDRNYFDRLKSRAVGRPNVVFHGAYRPADLPRLLAQVDVLVVPSLWWETFCLTIREGLLAGVPVIASDLGAMREALDGEQNGLLFRAGDPQDLADRLKHVIEDDATRMRLSNRREAVKTIETYAEEITKLYERAAEESPRRLDGLVIAPSQFPERTDGVRLQVESVTSVDGLRVENATTAEDGRSALVKVRLKAGGEATLRVNLEAGRFVDAPRGPVTDRRDEMRAAERAAEGKAAASDAANEPRRSTPAPAPPQSSGPRPERRPERRPESGPSGGREFLAPRRSVGEHGLAEPSVRPPPRPFVPPAPDAASSPPRTSGGPRRKERKSRRARRSRE